MHWQAFMSDIAGPYHPDQSRGIRWIANGPLAAAMKSVPDFLHTYQTYDYA